MYRSSKIVYDPAIDATPTFHVKDNVIICPENRTLDKRGLGPYFYDLMRKHKNITGQIEVLTGKSETFGEMLLRCVRTAIAMQKRGITSDDIISICSTNHIDTYIPQIAGIFLGAKFANTSPDLSLDETVYLLNQIRPKMIFAMPESVQLIANALNVAGLEDTTEIVVFGESPVHTNFSEFLKESPMLEESFTPTDVAEKETAAIVFSSGTSGLPKGICLSHLTIKAQIHGSMKPNLNVPETFLAYASSYWNSSMVALHHSLANGLPRLLLPKFEAEQLWDIIEKYHVMFLILTPYFVTFVLKNGRPRGADTSSLKTLAIWGSTLSEEQLRSARKMFPTTEVLYGYGLSELGGGAFAFMPNRPEDSLLHERNPTSVGRPIPGLSYKIIDVETEKVLGPNRPGELLIKTRYCMNGYHLTNSSNEWDSDGFLRSGDMVYYDEDYCFYVVDRIKEMFKYQDYQIVPSKLEGVLRSHSQVENVVVFGTPHSIDANRPAAVVTLRTSASNVGPRELEEFAKERVEDKYRPRGGVFIVREIPTTPSDKLKRKFTKDLLLAGKLRVISSYEIDGITGETDTYGSFLRRSIRVALKMRSMGIDEEDTITLCSHNHLNSNLPIIASFMLGTNIASIDPSLPLDQIVPLLKQANPKLIFTSPGAVELIEDAKLEGQLLSEIVVFGEDPNHVSFSEFLAESLGEEENFKPRKVEDLTATAAVFFSSGTSGLPKGIRLNHVSILGQTNQVSPPRDGAPSSVILTYSPHCWMSSLTMLINCIAGANTRLVLPEFDARKFWDVVKAYKVFMAMLAPAQLLSLCAHGRPENADTSSLKLVVSGGSYVSDEQITKLQEIMPESVIQIGFGMTEFGGAVLNFRPTAVPEDFELLMKKQSSCGRPLPGFSYKVVDLTTEKALGPNEQGELRIQSKFCMNGYNEVDSSKKFDADGFLKTGDVVYYDEDLCFHFVDRAEEIVYYHGWRISTAKIETILESHPGIERAMMLGIPSSGAANRLVAVIMLRKARGTIGAEDIQKYLAEKSGEVEKLGIEVKIVEEIPVTPASKLRRKYIKDLVNQGVI